MTLQEQAECYSKMAAKLEEAAAAITDEKGSSVTAEKLKSLAGAIREGGPAASRIESETRWI